MVDIISPSIEKGVATIRSYVSSLPNSSGVYRMVGANGDVLYVGKAKALKKRVSSYTHFDKLPHRLQKMVSLTTSMVFINTHTEAEALILEANLIKKFMPRYNILLRDDKSFPYIVIKEDHDFPQIIKYRGVKKINGTYFGPFPNAGDVNRTLSILQRIFLLRNCSDNIFENRTRPCLQYHIKRCTAPCVGKVTKKEYADQVSGAQEFMRGKSRAVQEKLASSMQLASENQEYEQAASYRDRIRALTSIQTRHEINSDIGDSDVIAMASSEGKCCIQVFFYRSGRNLGNRAYFPRHSKDNSKEEILSAFIGQFYQSRNLPKRIVIGHNLEDKLLFEQAFKDRAGHNVKIYVPQKGKYKRALDFVIKNADQALKRHLIHSATQNNLISALADIFGLEDIPKRIEVYDNSHISGSDMVGAMIVAGEEGFIKNAYRKFNIKQAGKGDDYAMMREVLYRRFKRALLEDGQGVGSDSWPDLILIDGGAGQISACKVVLEDLGIIDDVVLVAIAKGEDRNAGREKFFMIGRKVFQLPIDDPTLHYLQRLRDEAHRFAIGTHRIKRKNRITHNPLDEISGIGSKRKKALLVHFGSAKAVAVAGVDELAKVEGVSSAMAQKIYDFFNLK